MLPPVGIGAWQVGVRVGVWVRVRVRARVRVRVWVRVRVRVRVGGGVRVRVGLGLGLGLGWLQPRSHKIAASTTQGCSLSCLGCSLRHVRLQVTWHQASRRVRWRWNTEAIFHDLDGTFTQH